MDIFWTSTFNKICLGRFFKPFLEETGPEEHFLYIIEFPFMMDAIVLL
jgi:hypothetical protein